MDNLLTNRLFLQYLAAAGEDIGSGNPIGTNVNAVTQQNIGAQSQAKLNEHYMKMLASILKGEVPAGGKMTMDETGTKFQIPHMSKETNPDPGFSKGFDPSRFGLTSNPGNLDLSKYNFSFGGGGGGGSSVPKLSAILNPSDSQPGITGADLAGLGPQDVSRALGGALDVQALMQQIPALQADILYKQARTKAALTPKDERTTDIKNYEYAKAAGYKGSFDEWKNGIKDEGTASIKNYEYARSQGYTGSFNEWEKDAKTSFQKDYEYDVKHGYKGGFHSWMLERLQQDKPDRVTWTTATRELTKRFGKLDATGMWAVTPDLQYAHRESQKILTELRDQGVEPLKAVNEAENMARKKQQLIEERYQQYLSAAKQIKNSRDQSDKIDEIKSLFYKRYGYIPSEVAR